MNTRLYIGNLKWDVNDDKLNEILSEAGKVVTANVVLDRNTGRSRGFAFAEMATEEDSKNAIDILNGRKIDNRILVVNEALPEKTHKDGVFMPRVVLDFVGQAEVEESFKFNIDQKHFTIRRDD